MTAHAVLSAAYPQALADAIVNAYGEIEQNFALGRWRDTEIDAGHFVEAVRRVLEIELGFIPGGGFTPIGTQLTHFHDGELARYEKATGDESFRLLIPRVLKAVNNIRNKRGAGHLGAFSANEMDSLLVLNNVKWVLAELVRLKSHLSPVDTQKLVDDIVERRLEVLWKSGSVTRILDEKMEARDQILVLLYDRDGQPEANLQASIEYKNPTNFKKILERLHKARMIDRWAQPGKCLISPKGRVEAERIIKKSKGLLIYT